MKAIVSVVGRDSMGIIAKVSSFLFSIKANVEDVSQTLLQDYFSMIMLCDISKCTKKIAEIGAQLEKLGNDIGMSIRIQHEDIFNTMHKI